MLKLVRGCVITGLVLFGWPGAAFEPRNPGAAEFFPLDVGSSWEYRVALQEDTAEYRKRVEVTDVLDQPGQPAEYIVSEHDESLAAEERADHPLIYRVAPAEGVSCLDCGGLLIPEPIEPGAQWIPEDGGERRIAGLFELEVINGRVYRDALLVSTRSADGNRLVDELYARDVGPIRTRNFRRGRAGEWELVRTEELIEHDSGR